MSDTALFLLVSEIKNFRAKTKEIIKSPKTIASLIFGRQISNIPLLGVMSANIDRREHSIGIGILILKNINNEEEIRIMSHQRLEGSKESIRNNKDSKNSGKNANAENMATEEYIPSNDVIVRNIVRNRIPEKAAHKNK